MLKYEPERMHPVSDPEMIHEHTQTDEEVAKRHSGTYDNVTDAKRCELIRKVLHYVVCESATRQRQQALRRRLTPRRILCLTLTHCWDFCAHPCRSSKKPRI